MRWQGREQSDNIEDRRGMRVPGGRGAGFGCVGLLARHRRRDAHGRRSRSSCSGLLGLVEQIAPQIQQQQAPVGPPAADDPQAQFIGVVLKDTENAWTTVFQKTGGRYEEPTLVLFDGRVDSACGLASAAVGPFYCPADRKVYLDTAFFRELDQRFGAPGDFAPGVRGRARGRATTSRTSSGISDQVTARSSGRGRRSRRTTSRSGSSFRRTAWPASTATSTSSTSTRATSRRACGRRPRSATT